MSNQTITVFATANSNEWSEGPFDDVEGTDPPGWERMPFRQQLRSLRDRGMLENDDDDDENEGEHEEDFERAFGEPADSFRTAMILARTDSCEDEDEGEDDYCAEDRSDEDSEEEQSHYLVPRNTPESDCDSGIAIGGEPHNLAENGHYPGDDDDSESS